MTDLDLIQKLMAETGIVQVTVMPPSDITPSRYGVIRKCSDVRGFGFTLQDAFDDCKEILP